jgi:hypothetical protein
MAIWPAGPDVSKDYAIALQNTDWTEVEAFRRHGEDPHHRKWDFYREGMSETHRDGSDQSKIGDVTGEAELGSRTQHRLPPTTLWGP